MFFFHLDIEILQLKEEVASIAAKNSICSLKIDEIERQLIAEKEISKHIDEITPVKFTFSNAIDKKATDALAAVKAELQKFYDTFSPTENYEGNFYKYPLFSNSESIFMFVILAVYSQFSGASAVMAKVARIICTNFKFNVVVKNL